MMISSIDSILWRPKRWDMLLAVLNMYVLIVACIVLQLSKKAYFIQKHLHPKFIIPYIYSTALIISESACLCWNGK